MTSDDDDESCHSVLMVCSTVHVEHDERLDGDAVAGVQLALHQVHQPRDLLRAALH